MKNVQLIQDLTKRAMDRGVAQVKRQGKLVYEAYKSFDLLTVVHYGTVILQYRLDSKEIVNYGGYSISDRDALNNVLQVVGHSDDYFRVKNGNLTLVKGGN